MSYSINVVAHDNWPKCERLLLEDSPKLTLALQEHLKDLCESLCETLKPALYLERRFGEQNDKTMYLAPFIRSVIHATATAIDIQHVSLYPLAVDPCLARDPLFKTFLKTVQPRCYGLVTGIICGTVPFPVDCSGCGEQEDAVSVQDPAQSDSEESSVDFLDWINGYEKKKGVLSTAFYHDQTPPASEKSALLDYSFLARLTVNLVEDTTPLSLLCIGQDDELQSAMTSCLFQRATWGIQDPLVGIALDRTTTVRILIGWLKDTAESDCFVVHIAQDTSCCYDLSTASEAFKFASIIANVGQRFSTTCQAAIAFTEQLKDNVSEHLLKVWRLDQIDLAPCIVPKEPSPTAKIDSWLAGVPLSEYVNDGRSSPSSLTSISIESFVIEASTGSPSRRVLGHSSDDDNRRTRFWLFSRLAVTRTLFPYALLKNCETDTKTKSGNLTPEDLYQTVSSQYYDLVSFSWFDRNAEPLDATLNDELLIIREAKSAVDQLKLLGSIGQYPPYKPLSKECDKILRDNLHDVALVYEDIQQLVNMEGKTGSELECRHHLDPLMLKFFHGSIDSNADVLQDYSKPHVMVSLKCSLSLPRAFVAERSQNITNIIIHQMLITAVVRELRAPLTNDVDTITDFLMVRYPTPLKATVDADANHSTFDECALHARFQQDLTALACVAGTAGGVNDPGQLNPLSQPEGISDCHKEEPERIVCDSVGFIRIQDVFTSKTASAAFNLIHPSANSELRKRTVVEADGVTTAGRFRKGQTEKLFQPDDIFAHSQNLVATRATSNRSVSEESVLTDVGELCRPSLKSTQLVRGDHRATSDVPVVDLQKDLFLPIIMSVHTKVLTTCYAANINEGRMCATAAVKFYAAIGIYGLGVYTVISEGSVALVTVSYGEQVFGLLQDHMLPPHLLPTDSELTTDPTELLPSKVHIIERNAISFDLAHPLGLVNFVTFLIKLRIEYVPMVVKMVHLACSERMQERPEEPGEESLQLQSEMKVYLKSMGIILDGSYKATWRRHRPN